MIYDNLSTSTLKDFHDSIRECLKNDESTPNRQALFDPIVLASAGNAPRPTPIEAVFYERIKHCLSYEDSLPGGAERPYGVRKHNDWHSQANSLENALDRMGYLYSKIVW